ncbi:MAG: sigma 54-interacting transcriptional regulator [Tepidanaerobacteraceae bacterium]
MDEIAEMPITLQAKLLRVIQEKEIMRIGSDKLIPIDVRVISATNKDIWQEVAERSFREDLYYRLNVLELKIPPLRRRKEDIPVISSNFVKQSFPDTYINNKEKWEKIFLLLQGLDLYGNVRELQNILKRLAIIIASNEYENTSESELIKMAFSKKETQNHTVQITENDELKNILEALNESNWNKQKAADRLGISRTTLWRKLKIYNIK